MTAETDLRPVLWRSPKKGGGWMYFDHEPTHLTGVEPLLPAHAIASLQAEIEALRAERDALRDVLDRIVSYYDILRHNGRMPSMAYQAESDHENTMFGQARILLTKEQP
jgi:hypothetical protein